MEGLGLMKVSDKFFFLIVVLASTNSYATSATISFRDAVNNGSDSDGGLTANYVLYVAGTATISDVPGNGNHGNATAGGSLTILNQDSAGTDGNNNDFDISNDTLNNYIVHAFEFNQPVTLAEPFRVHDLDWDHRGTDEYQDAISVVVGNGGILTNLTGTTPSTLPEGTSPSGSTGVTNFDIAVGGNPASGPAGGPALDSFATLTGYMNDDLNFDSGPEIDGDGAHSNIFHGVDFDLSSTPVDSIYVVYWNAINSNETGGVQGISIGEQPAGAFTVVPEPTTMVLMAISLLGFSTRRSR